MRFTKIIPSLPSRTQETEYTLYNWFLNLSRWLRETIADVSNEIDTVVTSLGVYALKSPGNSPGQDLDGTWIFGDNASASIIYESLATLTFNTGNIDFNSGFLMNSADGTSGQYQFYVGNTGDFFIYDYVTSASILAYNQSTYVVTIANVNLSGTRLTADFSNATASLRTSIQTNVTNGATVIQALPNGTGTTTVISSFNGSDLDNSAYCYVGHTSTEARLLASKVGTGVAKPLAIYANGIKSITIDTSAQTTFEKPFMFASQYTHPTTTGSSTVDFANAQNIKLTMTGNCTLAFSFPGIGNYRFTVVSGANTITWPTINANWQWLGSTSAPTLNTGTYGGVVEIYYDGTLAQAIYRKIGAA